MGSQVFQSEKINREGAEEAVWGGKEAVRVEKAFDFLAKQPSIGLKF